MSLQSSASTALPTHDPASVPCGASPEPPRALYAPPWLAPSTPTAGTVTRSLRLPTVAECAELLAAGWSPLLGRLGVWTDDSGDSRAMWWTWALEIARRDAARDRSRAGADGGGGRAVAPRCATSGRSVPVPRLSQIVSLNAECVSHAGERVKEDGR